MLVHILRLETAGEKEKISIVGGVRMWKFKSKTLDILRRRLLRDIKVELFSRQWVPGPICQTGGGDERQVKVNVTIWMALCHECGRSLRERL